MTATKMEYWRVVCDDCPEGRAKVINVAALPGGLKDVLAAHKWRMVPGVSRAHLSTVCPEHAEGY